MFRITSVAMFTLHLTIKENECCQCITNNKSSSQLTNVYGKLKMVTALLLKLDEYIFPIRTSIFKGVIFIKVIFFQKIFKYIFNNPGCNPLQFFRPPVNAQWEINDTG